MSTDLKSRLLAVMDRKMHWAWPVLSGPTATRSQLRIHYEQEWEVYVRDFPIFLSRVHHRCPDAEVRRELAENLYEEETGGLSQGRPHPELFLELMEGLGLAREDFGRVRLLPASANYREWLDRTTLEAAWPVALAVATIFVEGSVHEREDVSSHPPPPPDPEQAAREHFLVRHHGVDPAHMGLIRAHRAVEHGHRESAWRMVLRSGADAPTGETIVAALERALDLWTLFRDGVVREAGIAA